MFQNVFKLKKKKKISNQNQRRYMLFLFDNVVNAECLFELKHQSGSDSFDYGWGASFLTHFAVLQVAVIFFGHL